MAKKDGFIVIPKSVLLDKRLGKASLREFYGVIMELSKREGYCYASDMYLARLLDCDPRTITRWIKKLKNFGYIKTDHIRRDGNKRIERRLIYPIAAIPTQMSVRDRHKCLPGTDTNVRVNNKRIINKDYIKEDDYESVGWA